MGYFVWHELNGKAYYKEFVDVPCHDLGNHKSWTDEYGTYHHCPGGCRGTGKVSVPRLTRVPEYNAPTPPADFVLEEHKQRINDEIYFGGTAI